MQRLTVAAGPSGAAAVARARARRLSGPAGLTPVRGPALRVVRVDLARRPAAGKAFNVMTAPTTVVLAGDGRVGSFNHGFAPADRLSSQVSALGVAPASPR